MSRFFRRSTFDEANYYDGSSFELGGNDRRQPLFHGATTFRIHSFRSDESIQEDAWQSLTSNFKIDLGRIDVVVKEGVLRLLGSARSLSEKREVEKCVEHIPGVVEIVNDLRIARLR